MVFKVGDIQVLHGEPGIAKQKWTGIVRETHILRKGHRKSPQHRAFLQDTIFERDVEIPVRDGTILRGDVFRPSEASSKVPAIIAFSPYGKTGTGPLDLNIVPGRAGVPQSALSGYESWEAPDPAEWIPRGYAIVNIDTRGVYGSGGDLRFWGSSEGRDGYDAIEHIAQLSWCNGRTTLCGNSWLAVTQWFIAAERPPHLSCIAPLEGASDIYRETVCRGGVPCKPFFQFMAKLAWYGNQKQEDIVAMLDKYPLWNAYWADKRAAIEKITVPAYVLASYSTGLHTPGSFRGFEEMTHNEKWLRVHATQEWHDLYQPACIEELNQFFDHYMKDIENGWEKTPHIRVSLLGFNKEHVINKVFPDWPVKDTEYRTLFLSHDGKMAENSSEIEATFSYQSDVPAIQVDEDSEELHFTYTFQKATSLLGYSKAILYMSCEDHDDLDIFVQLRKADKNGNILQNLNIPIQQLGLKEEEVETINTLKYLGPTGILRASHREVDMELSKPNRPHHPHRNEQRVSPGTMVKLEIGLWPSGIVFDAGEKIVFKVAGHHMTLAEFTPQRGQFIAGNKGKHQLHVGGANQSCIVIPLLD